METKKCECTGCHRVLFSYQPPGENEETKKFEVDCPMCGTPAKVQANVVIYDEFLSDPSLKGDKHPRPPKPMAKPPEPKELPKGTPRIKIAFDVEPPDALSDVEKWVLQRIINDGLSTFMQLIQAGQIELFASKVQEMDRMVQAGLQPGMMKGPGQQGGPVGGGPILPGGGLAKNK